MVPRQSRAHSGATVLELYYTQLHTTQLYTAGSYNVNAANQYISGPVLPALKLPPVRHLCLHRPPTTNILVGGKVKQMQPIRILLGKSFEEAYESVSPQSPLCCKALSSHLQRSFLMTNMITLVKNVECGSLGTKVFICDRLIESERHSSSPSFSCLLDCWSSVYL